MAVTIEMIQEKEFRRQANGYDTNEVDDLLDDIMDEMEAREHELKDLRARLAQAQADAEKAPRAAEPKDDSESARVLLANAQRVYDQTVADAQNRAAEILAKAQEDADRAAANARKETQSLNDQLDTAQRCGGLPCALPAPGGRPDARAQGGDGAVQGQVMRLGRRPSAAFSMGVRPVYERLLGRRRRLPIFVCPDRALSILSLR